MKFLVDAQLPELLAELLNDAGHEAIHTCKLPNANRTTDSEIARMADNDGRIVVSKDRDFRVSHLLSGTPRELLIVATGNISNADLLSLVEEHLVRVVEALEQAKMVELSPLGLVIHDD